ncbi:MAG: hypothetical protein HOL28_05215 [Crocinitomicaceae bacterium]|nr:hypothetical protein [Crocinitomicaceae bacterium]
MQLIRKYFIWCVLLLQVGFSSAQGEIVANFRLASTGNEVLLSWDITSGNTCDGISVLKSSDGINFQLTHFISGICGSILEPIPYTYLDENPESGWNFYKIQPGFFDESKILSIEIIDIEKNGHVVRPQPVTDQARIYFNNSTNKEHTIAIYTAAGNLVFKELTILNFFQVTANQLPKGHLFFAIYSTNEGLYNTAGKLFIIQ